MVVHKHNPVSYEEMKWASPENTICETIRRAYNLIGKENNGAECIKSLFDAQTELRTATAMAKAMTKKLEEYKRNWRKGFWDENPDFPVKRHKKPIDVLFLCWDDNANTMYRFWLCAKHLGLNTVMFKGKTHPFGYPVQAPIHPSLTSKPICASPTTIMAPGLESLINSAHVVHLGASTYPMAAVDWSKTNVVVQHGGTVYRQNPKACNDLFNQFASSTIIQCPDLLGLGANNEHWIYYPVDTVNIRPDFGDKGDVPVIGHFPSNPEVKGTDLIESVLADLAHEGLKFKYVGSSERVPWAQNLERMSKCDIIIEGCNATQGDKVYGEWGNTAIEASALGCAVITHCLSQDDYSCEFGDPPGFLVANDAAQVTESVKYLLRSDTNLCGAKRQCHKWAENNHSIPATANRLWDKVYKGYFA